MKLRCDRRAFLESVSLVAGVTPSRNTRPILQHVLLSVGKDSCDVAATDLEVSIRSRFRPLSVDEPGTMALPASKMLGILRESRGETVDLANDGLMGTLRTAGSQFRISGVHPGDFPEVPTGEGAEFLEIPCGVFREMAERAEVAAAKELGRYAINGILMEVTRTGIRMVSTDGRRLVLAESKLATPPATEASEIVPLRGVSQFLKALHDGIEVVGLSLDRRRALLRAGDTVLSATSVEAEFPEYSGVVQARGSKVVVLDRDDFLSCVRQAAVMVGDEARTVTLQFSEGSLAVSGAAEGVGDARSEIAANYVGAPVRLSFNPDYLLDLAKLRIPAQFPLEFEDGNAAATVRLDETFLYMIMPVNPS